MPDYDPKSIPILDDIIEGENESADTAETNDEKIISEQISTDLAATENIQDDNTLDLFNDNAADIKTDASEPGIGAIDKFIDSISEEHEIIEIENSETEIVESALIDYQTEDNITANDIHTADEQHEQHQTITSQSALSEQPITLDSIVDDVVKQLVPDLAQQLRFLVRQALEEKLPEEIINKLSAKNDEQT